MLAGDRFYGTADLIQWCQQRHWQYRLRLKGNLCVFQDQGPDKTLDALKQEGIKDIDKARMRSGVTTHIGILHEKGHKEPWFIAMDTKPNEYKTRDYGMRWGIENMFSDFKSRGFALSDSKIRIRERLERLVLIFSIALHWAVSAGLYHEKYHPSYAEKNNKKKPIDPVSRFLNAASALSDDASKTMMSLNLYGIL